MPGLLFIAAVAFGVALLVQTFVAKPYRIPSESMEPTLDIGQRVIVNRLAYRVGDPARGDIVVFHPPEQAHDPACGASKRADEACRAPVSERDGDSFIKRIVAVGGDRLSIRSGHAVVNGRTQTDQFVRPCPTPGPPCSMPRTIRIPPEHFFMMGDNRGASYDSRHWGPVPEKWIIGEAIFSYWPPNKVGPE